jgi:uncharacterized membrane protein YbhN (UPF0104 family)
VIKKKWLVGVISRSWKSRCTEHNSKTSTAFHEASLPESSMAKGGGSLSLVNQRWRNRAKTAAQWTVVIATAVIIFRVGNQHWSEFNDLDLQFAPFGLVNAAVATTAANLLLPLGWRRLIASYGRYVAAGRAVRLWCLAQTARYLPTGLVAVASRLQLATKEGIPRSLTAISIAVETLVLLGWSVVICVLFVPSTVLPEMMRWVSGVIAATGLVAAPWLIPAIGERLSRIEKFAIPQPRRRLLADGVALLGASVAVRAVGTVALAAAFLDMGSADVSLIVGATYAAVIAGMIGITPAGLGVREGVLAAILVDRFGLADAAAFALLSRVWEFGFEMAFLGAASWWGRQRPGNDQLDAESGVDDGRL